MLHEYSTRDKRQRTGRVEQTEDEQRRRVHRVRRVRGQRERRQVVRLRVGELVLERGVRLEVGEQRAVPAARAAGQRGGRRVRTLSPARVAQTTQLLPKRVQVLHSAHTPTRQCCLMSTSTGNRIEVMYSL